MLARISKIFRPAVFQGKNQSGNYFEGWFYKLVDESRKNVCAFIPGIYIDKNEQNSHAFIQMLDNPRHDSSYLHFPLEQFEASNRNLYIKIGDNIFTDRMLSISLKTDHGPIAGTVKFDGLNPWPVSILSPGIMGWYAYVPFMECYHGVVSLDHRLHGSLELHDRTIDFSKGRGYIEKDWGKSFPSAYLWIQSNHFQKIGTSLMVSVAKIPWLSGSFRGFIIGLLTDGTLHRFTTYNGAQLNFLKIDDATVHLEVQNRNYKLSLAAKRTTGGILHAPYKTKMQRVSETLNSTVDIQLIRHNASSDKLVFEGQGAAAGLDVNGKLEEIIG
ncbi:hypothetical protein GF337_09125 [candidate division KSB1 bacterium]|nr:hypothetical protein [candidate division KSB1 bacterium]